MTPGFLPLYCETHPFLFLKQGIQQALIFENPHTSYSMEVGDPADLESKRSHFFKKWCKMELSYSAKRSKKKITVTLLVGRKAKKFPNLLCRCFSVIRYYVSVGNNC